MRRTISVLAAAVVTAACGGASGARPDPAALATCTEVASAVVDVIQESIDLVDAAADAREEPDEGEAADLEAAGADLEERARALGCTDEEMAALIAGMAARLEARSVYGQLIIEGLRAADPAPQPSG